VKWLDIFSRSLLYIVGFLMLMICIQEYSLHGWNWVRWDFMFISGLLVFIIALYFAQSIPKRMAQTLVRLVNRGAFKLAKGNLKDYQAEVSARGKRFGQVFAVVVGAAILIAFTIAYKETIINKLPITILETFLGLVAGYYIGLMVAYGTMGQLAKKKEVEIVTQPGHIDRAAGLKPIGDYYFFQAMIVAMPCAFIAVWWFIIPVLTPWYSHWRNPYLLLLIIALAFEILSFILPMWVFHEIMQDKKQGHLEKADEISQKITELENQIITATDSSLLKELQKQLTLNREKYWEIENTPTWPLDTQTRRRFTFNNLALFSPFALDFISSSDPWRKLLDMLVNFLTDEG
jgi:hypothetical protein